jgi:hypothetical protein
MTIQEKCSKLTRDFHGKVVQNDYQLTDRIAYERVFSALDLIEDCQNAIEEYDQLPDANFRSRSSLYIYGVLQAICCQQDGLFHLYKNTVDPDIKNVYRLFATYNFDRRIRTISEDITGHLGGGKKRKKREFYYISKGTTRKNSFSYAGFSPYFRKADVNLKKLIEAQNYFTRNILNEVERGIYDHFREAENEKETPSLAEKAANLTYPIQLIARGIYNNHALTSSGLDEVNHCLDELRLELERRYDKDIPPRIKDIFRMQTHITGKLQKWLTNQELQNNLDAEVFVDSLIKQAEALVEALRGMEDEG